MTPKATAPAGHLDQSAEASPAPSQNQGPLGGKWILGSWTCGANDIFNQAQSPLGVRGIGLDVDGAMAKQSALFFGSCTATQNYTYSFPSGGQLSMLMGTTTCSGGCSASQCITRSAPIPARSYGYGYALSGSQLTMSRTLTTAETLDVTSPYKMAGCTDGQKEILVFSKN